MQAQEAIQISQNEYQHYFRAATNLENAQACGIRGIKWIPNTTKVVIDRDRSHEGIVGYVIQFVLSLITDGFAKTTAGQIKEKVDFVRHHDLRVINRTHEKLAQILSTTPNPESYYTLRTARLFHELFPKMQAWNQSMDEKANPWPSLVTRIKRLFENRLGYAISDPGALKVKLDVQIGAIGKGVDSPECADFVATLKTIREKRWEYQPPNLMHTPRNIVELELLGKMGWNPDSARAIATTWQDTNPKIAQLAGKHSSKMCLDRYAVDDYLETGDLASEGRYFGIPQGDLRKMVNAMQEKNPDPKLLLQFARACVFHARQSTPEFDFRKRELEPVSHTLLRPIKASLEKSCASYTQAELTTTLRQMLEIAVSDGYMRNGEPSYLAQDFLFLLAAYGKATSTSQESLKMIFGDVTKGLIVEGKIARLQNDFDGIIKDSK